MATQQQTMEGEDYYPSQDVIDRALLKDWEALSDRAR
jgi:hypothetical protein